MDDLICPAGVDPVREAERTLQRLLPRLRAKYQGQSGWPAFELRLHGADYQRLFQLLYQLYGQHYDFLFHLEATLELAADSWLARPDALKQLDRERSADAGWFTSNRMVGGMCYVDLFAGDLQGVRQKIPYFKELGLTYLHLMPLFKVPEGDSDGGYAVADYRSVREDLGTTEELRQLATELRQAGISLVLDFVFNHTADTHRWALAALAGDKSCQDFYFFYPDRQVPDQLDSTLREIFPSRRPGCFSYRAEVDAWVWTTFNSFQWDLNYRNPAVYRAMAGELLFLANLGTEVARLDALAFSWKEAGTDCENLDKAHLLIQAFNAVARLAAPSFLFKSEAIVHPDQVIRYVSPHECQLSYNPNFMALMWEALATRETRLVRQALSHRMAVPEGTAWINYLRCHDDIGWGFDDGDAGRVGIDGFGHRQFLNRFYSGRFEGSFARGVPFQENPRTGDARITGMLASLTGLEQSRQLNDEQLHALALARIGLLHGVMLAASGIPLLYLGDEIGKLNDYSYLEDEDKAEDSRWVNRPATDWQQMARRHEPDCDEQRVFGTIQRLIRLRKETAAFNGSSFSLAQIDNPHLLAFVRRHGAEQVLVLANFSEHELRVPANELRLYTLSYQLTDLISGRSLVVDQPLKLEPYDCLWLKR